MLVFEERGKLKYLGKKPLRARDEKQLVDSWSRATDHLIQMYPDWDTIPQLLPSELFVCSAVIVKGKV